MKTTVKNDRSIILYTLLTLLTCGIYDLYFVHSVAKDTNTICSERDYQKTPGLLLYILLNLLTCGFYSYYWYYKLGDRLVANARGQFNISLSENGTSVLLWLIVGRFICVFLCLVGYNVIIKNLNALASAYNDSLDSYDYSDPTPSTPRIDSPALEKQIEEQ